MGRKRDLENTCYEHNTKAEKEAQRQSLKKIDYIEKSLAHKFGDTISIKELKSEFPLYEDFGYYPFVAETDYISYGVSEKTVTVGTGSYSGSISSSGDVSLSQDTTTKSELYISESKAEQKEKRYIKVVAKDCAKEVATSEKLFKNNLEKANLFYEINHGRKMEKPKRIMFVLLGITTLLLALFALVFYLSSTYLGVKKLPGVPADSLAYWEYALLSKFTSLESFFIVNPSITYFAIAGFVITFLVIMFVFKPYIEQYCGPKHTVKIWFDFLFYTSLITFAHILLEALYAVAILTTIFSFVFVALYSFSRILCILCFIVLILLAIISMFGGYSAAVNRVEARCKFKKSDAYDIYVKNYNTIVEKTIFIEQFTFKRVTTYEQFLDIKKALKAIKKPSNVK